MNITEALKAELVRFTHLVPARRIKRALVRLIALYMRNEGRHGLPADINNLIEDFASLYALLDMIEDEQAAVIKARQEQSTATIGHPPTESGN